MTCRFTIINRRFAVALSFWGGIGLGILFLAAFLTHGFGFWVARDKGPEAPDLMTRHGNKILVPEGSALRSQLTVLPASAQSVSAKYVLPASIESDPARTAPLLPPLGGRVIRLKVGLGDRVTRGQVLAVIDSPDMAQAYDDRATMASMPGKHCRSGPTPN